MNGHDASFALAAEQPWCNSTRMRWLTPRLTYQVVSLRGLCIRLDYLARGRDFQVFVRPSTRLRLPFLPISWAFLWTHFLNWFLHSALQFH